MRHLHIDIETYSSESIADCGLYRYADAPDFRVLLIAYKADEDPTMITEVQDDQRLPEWLANALLDPGVTKHAHNAAFERVCLSVILRRTGVLPQGEWLDPAQWECSMVLCARAGLPLSLKEAGAELELEDQKMTEGRDLIRLFCTPHEPQSGLFIRGKRAEPADFPEEWETFKAYCVRDVDVESEICRRLEWLKVPPKERELYAEDQRINDRGVLVDMGLVRNAARADTLRKADLSAEAKALTGLGNPNSVTQLREWLSGRLGTPIARLDKKTIPTLMESAAKGSPERRTLEIRMELGKTSNKKYETIERCVCADGRVHGLFQFHGSRTGRWAGRLVQMQNLPQNHIEDLDFAREALMEGDTDLLQLCYGNVPDTISQLIRTAFVAPEGKTFAVCDFSAIEARVTAWLAGEDWVLDVFRKGGDIYCATASQMFHVPVEKHGRNADLRQKGKIAVLALGYGGGVAALEAMGGKRLGLTEDEECEIVGHWRKANPNIVRLWKALESAFIRCAAYDTVERVGGLRIVRVKGSLTVSLPSGRRLVYPKMRLGNHQGKRRLIYRGTNQKTDRYGDVETYGGKITENIVQAIARDCLGHVMLAVPGIVAHVHDEIITEVPAGTATQELEKIRKAFADTPEWAQGLPLCGAGYITPYYKKD